MTSLRVIEVIRVERETFSQLCAPVKMYSQILENVRVVDKETAMEDEGVVEAIKQASDFLGDRGCVLVCASGTEPLIVFLPKHLLKNCAMELTPIF